MYKNNESSGVQGLIPQQLVADSSALIEFLKEYYRYLHDAGNASEVINTISSNRDLDTVVDKYLELIRKEIGHGLYSVTSADKQNLYKHVGELYKAKGSLASFKLLFRLLFNVDVEISLPKEQILVASDGRWSQPNSLFIDVSSGDGFSLYGKSLNIPVGTRTVSVEVNRIKRIRQTSFYELGITQKSQYVDIPHNTTIFQNSVDFNIVNSLSRLTMVYAGQNFEVGQIFNINDGSQTGTNVKVSQVNDTGGIVKLEFLSFEPGYAAAFTTRLIPDSLLSSPTDPDQVVTTTATADQSTYPQHAIFTFTNSTLAQYPGLYLDNKGFLSDDIYLEDNFYYQQYSYVIKSGQQFSAYTDIVKKIAHPAGMQMFGEFEINNSFDLGRSIDFLARFYQERFYDTVNTGAESLWQLFKNPSDTVNPAEVFVSSFDKILSDSAAASQIYVATFSKPFSENISIAENTVFNYSKGLTESINSIDSGSAALNPYAISYFAEEYTQGITTFT